ncbi:MAG: hypothetical protein ACPL7R_00225 [Anaerolineae bacterium]
MRSVPSHRLRGEGQGEGYGAWLQVRGPDHSGGWVRADGVDMAKQ